MTTQPSTSLLTIMRRLAVLPESARPSTPRQIGAAGIALIKRFEGCARLRPDGLIEAIPIPARAVHRGQSAGVQPARTVSTAA